MGCRVVMNHASMALAHRTTGGCCTDHQEACDSPGMQRKTDIADIVTHMLVKPLFKTYS